MPDSGVDAFVEPREKFDPLKPRMGGNARRIVFTAAETAVLERAADHLIPPGAGFPAPSEVGVLEFIAAYVTPSGQEVTHFPFAGEDAFRAGVAALGEGFVAADEADQIQALKQVEADSPDFFGMLLNLVYYGYYSRPEVAKAIRQTLEAGRDYQAAPQPYGYREVIEDWPDELIERARTRGSFAKTEEIVGLDLSGLTFLHTESGDAAAVDAL
jgi:hypothetical protein